MTGVRVMAFEPSPCPGLKKGMNRYMSFLRKAGYFLENILNVEMDLKWLLFPTALIIPPTQNMIFSV